jgi:hypothetical protein
VVRVPIFTAHVELQFEGDDLAAGGKRLRELAQAARAVGFELKAGRVEPAISPGGSATEGWTRYTPEAP